MSNFNSLLKNILISSYIIFKIFNLDFLYNKNNIIKLINKIIK